MPNMKGGKKYKAGKHTDEKSVLHEIDTEHGQSIGRVLRHLGDRNVLLYCNDTKERIGHIRGGLTKKKAKIDVGDIVLYSNRGDGIGSSNSDNRADILEKFNHDTHRELKNTEGVNPRLFLQLERVDTVADKVQDDGVDFEEESDEELSEEEAEQRRKKKQEESLKRADARNTKYNNVENDNVDANIDLDNL